MSTLSNQTLKIDDEWEKFMSINSDDTSSDCDEQDTCSMDFNNEILSHDITSNILTDAPKSSDIYISTKTKIAYLNQPIDLNSLFWHIPVAEYAKPGDYVIKKQMKFNSTEIESLQYLKDKLKLEKHYEEYVITHIDNPTGRIKFKDIRKISIGVSKKDIMSYRCKQKSAFYNCFVIILRMRVKTMFKEFHVKVFNTGKLEIPGIQNEDTYILLLELVLKILQPHVAETLVFQENSSETVLINSNFNCGFFINREVLYDMLKSKYNIQSIYDPCSYPGIQCKFYYNHDLDIQNGCQISEENKNTHVNISLVSFMIFRTGSVLIVGKCDESILLKIYDFLKNILKNEFRQICQINSKPIDNAQSLLKDKKKKIRRKTITVNIN
jgi:hypothetical protein